MLKLKLSLFATDENGNEVLVARGDTIRDIEDAGPSEQDRESYDDHRNVTFKFTPSHKQWTEYVMCDAVKLLKALEN